jgi:DnaJ-class molecular chaperone
VSERRFVEVIGGRRGGRSQVFRGADLRYELELDLPQAVFGHSVELDLPKLMECETCHEIILTFDKEDDEIPEQFE